MNAHHAAPQLPVAVIGAGPIGLAAAAHLISRGETPLVFELGSEVAHSVRQWQHVRIFSPWSITLDQVSVQLLAQHGWQAPDDLDALPTGRELIEQYLQPLAALPVMRDHIRLNSRVTAISRYRADKLKDAKRETTPFVVRYQTSDGCEHQVIVRAVIDASGTWTNPNPLGADGLPAIGEHENASRIYYGIPDVLGSAYKRYANKRVMVVGGGHSAMNALLELGDILGDAPQTQIHWVMRKSQREIEHSYGGGANDQLPARGALGQRVKRMVASGKLTIHSPVYVQRLAAASSSVRVIVETAGGQTQEIVVDEIITATGFRPDLSFVRELRVELDPSVEAPPTLAPLIDPNLHSCGSVPPHGEAELRHAREQGFYMVGMKSYGRAPTFLMATGYEQVRSIVAALVGDWDAAREVRLVLPETGVCRTDLVAGAGCCGTDAAQTLASGFIDLSVIR